MYIDNIQCYYKEYINIDNNWVMKLTDVFDVNNVFIQNMVDAGYYFTSMGGKQEIDIKPNRRFGLQVCNITCISFCGGIKKEFSFNYNNAKELF